MAAFDKFTVAILTSHRAAAIEAIPYHRVPERPAATIASHALGRHDPLLGRGNENVGMARRHVDLTGLDTGSE